MARKRRTIHARVQGPCGAGDTFQTTHLMECGGTPALDTYEVLRQAEGGRHRVNNALLGEVDSLSVGAASAGSSTAAHAGRPVVFRSVFLLAVTPVGQYAFVVLVLVNVIHGHARVVPA